MARATKDIRLRQASVAWRSSSSAGLPRTAAQVDSILHPLASTVAAAVVVG